MRTGSLRRLLVLCVSAVMAIALVSCLYPPALLSTNNLKDPDAIASTKGSAQPRSADLSALLASLQAKINELHQAASFPGATIGFVLPDGRSASVSVGLADVERKIPLKPTDRMLAGSIGKTYVSAAILQVVQEGKLDLDAKIESLFGSDAWFPRLPNAKDITLRMLMNHSSGIPEHVLNKGFIAAMKKDPDRIWKPEELIAYILDAKPLFAAGHGWSYADTNYILAGMIFERVTKKTVYGEVERRILKPLKLDRTIPSDRRALPEVIIGYSMPNSPFGFEGPVILDGKFIINPQMEWTGGGFASTAEDLARWAKLLYEGKVLKKETLDQMLTGVEAKEGRGSGAGNKYGLAVQIRQSEWGMSYGHGGWFPGYLSEMEYFPRQSIAVAVQFNTDASRTLKKGPRAYIADAMRIIVAEIEKKKAA
jgi:D-alanyl-D-alanine carboxypeptidase